jgi:hypothetical protein
MFFRFTILTLRPANILSRKNHSGGGGGGVRRCGELANQNLNGKEIGFNALPQPGLLPKEKEIFSPSH